MKHPEDDDLILYLYGEAEEPRQIEAQLAASPALRDRLEALRRVLDAASTLPVPERPASYGADLWKRIEPRIGVRRDRRDRREFPVLWGLAAAALLLLAVGFWAGRVWPPPPEAARPIPAEARERILLATLAAHLESSERLLTEVANTGDSGPADLSAERAWARDLLAANRLYRRSAGLGGRPRLEALLDELEPVLLELAHAPDEPAAEELDDLRQRITDRALLFKTRVVSDRLERRKQTL
jgi:hypothetical protein